MTGDEATRIEFERRTKLIEQKDEFTLVQDADGDFKAIPKEILKVVEVDGQLTNPSFIPHHPGHITLERSDTSARGH